MDINFESDFLKSLSKYKIKDRYYDEYLKTTRYHLLNYNHLYDQYNQYSNNNIINDNKITYIHVDESAKETLMSKIKILILKQKKLYNNLIHHYKTTQPELLQIIDDDDKSVKSIKSVKSTKSMESTISIKSTKSTKTYRVDRKKEKELETMSLNEQPKKPKFRFFTRKNKNENV